MPGAGKSTVGRLLAERLHWPFLDTDLLIEQRCGMPLQALLDEHGLAGFRAEEQAALLSVDCAQYVVATGGSAVYSQRGMQALRRRGVIVFLHCPLEVLAARVGDPSARGMVIGPQQSFEALFNERLPLYRRHADLEIACADDTPDTVAARVLLALPR
jgi:shikimate kinase